MLLKYLLEKEMKQIVRNRFLPRMIIMFPILIMLVAPWITNMEVTNIRLVVVDNDRSSESLQLTHRLEASRYYQFKGLLPSYAAALKEVEHGQADLVAVIPPYFGSRPKQHVLIAANAVNGTRGSMGASYLANILAGSGAQSSIATLNLFNVHQNYKLFMIPALMAMLLIMFCGFMPALNIVGEKESGTMEQINVSPVGRFTFIVAKLIPYWFIGLFVLSVCFVLSWAVYGLTPVGAVAWLYLLAALLALTMSGFGLIISNHSHTLQQAMFVMWFFTVVFILLSGLFTPVRSMPQWAQLLTVLNPLRYFVEGMRTVFIRGGGWSSIASPLAALSLFATLMGLWAVASYRKTQ